MDRPVGLRERKRQRTRRAISDAAIDLFLEFGFDAVSVPQIAEAAEVSKPTLFKYFPTKEDLVVHRFADHRDEFARVVRDRPPGTPPLTALHRHFVGRLAARDPITGLNDSSHLVAFMRMLYATPRLTARLFEHQAHSAVTLAEALADTTAAPNAELIARLAAGQVVSTHLALAERNWRQMAAGCSADDVYPDAVAAADTAFALLESGLADALG